MAVNFGNWQMAAVVLLATAIVGDANELTRLQIQVDSVPGKAIPCRIHLYNRAGKAQMAPRLPCFRDHFVCDGRVTLTLPAGEYRYEIERGPEYRQVRGAVAVRTGETTRMVRQLERIADIKSLGWYAGDLHIHRPLADIELLMKAEDLDIGPVITWWNMANAWTGKPVARNRLTQFDGRRFYHSMGGEDERGGGALLYFHLDEPLNIAQAEREFPSPLAFANEARRRKPNVWIDIEKPFWWDVPTWLASGQADSIGIANNHMCRSQMYLNEAWGKARDEKRLPPPLGNGQWTQEIYHHILNCGLRIPPSAGSASGVLPNPVGYNRVYVHVDGELTWTKWWEGLKAGRSFVTNGPLLRVFANDQLPGAIFRSPAGKPLAIKLECSLTSLDKIRALDIVRDGRVIRAIKVADPLGFRSEATIEFSDSGWFLVRAIAENDATFRFAATAPFYVEVGPNPRRVSKKSALFFRDWTSERIERLRALVRNQDQLAEVLKPHLRGLQFWTNLADNANAE